MSDEAMASERELNESNIDELRRNGGKVISAPILMPITAPIPCAMSAAARLRYGPPTTNATAHAAPRYATATACRSPTRPPSPQ